MNGIDISSWQTGIDLSSVPCDFVISKASGGTAYVNPDFKRQIEQALSLGKLSGAYHFALDGLWGTTPEDEAAHFLRTVKPYLGRIILVLDWEARAIDLGAEWASRWLNYVKRETGVTAFVYMSQAVAVSPEWAEIAKDHPLWVAQYKNYDNQQGYSDNPWGDKTVGSWGSNIAIRQYCSTGILPGWEGRLDLNLSYIDSATWLALCASDPTAYIPAETVPATVTADDQVFQPIDVQKIAEEVIDGKWGNGLARKTRLGEFFYNTIQDAVNKILGYGK